VDNTEAVHYTRSGSYVVVHVVHTAYDDDGPLEEKRLEYT
jgi:hypothetical protein